MNDDTKKEKDGILFDTLREMYKFEHAEKHSMYTRVSLAITGFALIAGGTSSLFFKYGFSLNKVFCTIELIMAFGFFVAIVKVLINFYIFFFKSNEYSYIMDATKKKYFEDNPAEDDTTDKDLINNLKEDYRKTTTQNRETSIKRKKLYLKIMFAIFLMTVCMVLLGTVYIIDNNFEILIKRTDKVMEERKFMTQNKNGNNEINKNEIGNKDKFIEGGQSSSDGKKPQWEGPVKINERRSNDTTKKEE